MAFERAPGGGRKPGTKMPAYQVRPVIAKKTVTTMVGRDSLSGPTARQKQKGVQCQKRIKGLSEDGVLQSPYVAHTIQNYETTYDNMFVRLGEATPDEVYEMLMEHPARQKDVRNTATNGISTRPGRFVLVPYVAELTEEEVEMTRNGAPQYEEVMPKASGGTVMGPASAANAFPSADQLNGEPEAAPVAGVTMIKAPVHEGEEVNLIV